MATAFASVAMSSPSKSSRSEIRRVALRRVGGRRGWFEALWLVEPKSRWRHQQAGLLVRADSKIIDKQASAMKCYVDAVSLCRANARIWQKSVQDESRRLLQAFLVGDRDRPQRRTTAPEPGRVAVLPPDCRRCRRRSRCSSIAWRRLLPATAPQRSETRRYGGRTPAMPARRSGYCRRSRRLPRAPRGAVGHAGPISDQAGSQRVGGRQVVTSEAHSAGQSHPNLLRQPHTQSPGGQ